MKPILVALLALFALAAEAHARPVVIEESVRLAPPTDRTWEGLGTYGVAIDGDFALVSAHRSYEDPSREYGIAYEMTAQLYRRSGTSWNYIGPLLPAVEYFPEYDTPSLSMKGGVAVVVVGTATRIFERTNDAWIEQPSSYQPFAFDGPTVKVDAGRILANRACFVRFHSVVLNKINGAWAREGELLGNDTACDPPANIEQDIQGTRAFVLNGEAGGATPILRKYQFNGGSWVEYGAIEGQSVAAAYDFAMNGPYTALNGPRNFGTRVYVEGQSTSARYGIQPAGAHMDQYGWTGSIERAGDLFAQGAWSHDANAYVVNLFRMNGDAAHTAAHVATLRARNGLGIGAHFDRSGRWMIVSDAWDNTGSDRVRIFDLPANLASSAVQVHDFETSGAAALWQPTAGSVFSLARVGNTQVYRQASAELGPASWLPDTYGRNQSIQAEIKLNAISGTDRWVGLATRRTDDSNYYYVAVRTSGRVELKKVVNGVFTTLATATGGTAIAPGIKQRVRLESIGALHRVYVDDYLAASVTDDSHKRGVVGVLMNRAAADYDNVIVSPTPFTTIYKDNFVLDLPTEWRASGGLWNRHTGNRQLYQQDESGYARYLVGARTDDQVVQVRVQPTSFAGPDYWVGLLLRYQDERNHVYVSLHQRGVISLWRRTNGAIRQLATRRFPVSAYTWYTLRAEVVNGATRVFVNDELQLASNADPGPSEPGVAVPMGKVGLITYRATAVYENFMAYQP